MKTRYTVALPVGVLLFLGLVLPTGEAVSQQAGPTFHIAYSVIDYPDEVAAATAQLSTNAAGYARVTIRPLLTAEEMDKAVAKWPPGPPSATTIEPRWPSPSKS
jgi:hypothetical protein